MITFIQFLEQQNNLDEGLMGKIAAGAGLLAAGLGAGYALKGNGTPSSSTTYPAAQDFMPQTTQVTPANNDYESLVKSYMQQNKDNPKYKGTMGKFRNLRQDAEEFAHKKITGGKSGKFTHNQGEITDTNQSDSDNYTSPNAKSYLKKSGSIED